MAKDYNEELLNAIDGLTSAFIWSELHKMGEISDEHYMKMLYNFNDVIVERHEKED